MTTLRTVAVVAGLLASGFTAERLASHAPGPTPPTTPAAEAHAAPPVPAAARSVPEPARPVSLGARLSMGPVQGPVSSPFGARVHPVSGRVHHHDGVDLAVPAGTAVWAVAPGTVRAAGRRPGYGLAVEVDHPTGLGCPARTLYAHLASLDPALRPGSPVALGQALGASGGVPGRDGVSTGAHLHFEVRDAEGRPLDPGRFVRLPAAASRAPRWGSPGTVARATAPPWPAPSAGPPASTPDDGATGDRAEADSLASPENDLPDLVLPDYPTLPAVTGTL